MTRRSRSGFTLIELIIVVAIIAVLVVVLLAVLLSARKKGDIAKARSFVTSVMTDAIQKWQTDIQGGANTIFPPAGNSQRDDGPDEGYYEGNMLLFEELVTKPSNTEKGAYVGKDTYTKGEPTDGRPKPVFVDPWGKPYVYRNYSVKKARDGKGSEYRGKRYNDTYDIISAGPNGTFGDDDDIYNGSDK